MVLLGAVERLGGLAAGKVSGRSPIGFSAPSTLSPQAKKKFCDRQRSPEQSLPATMR